MKSDLKGEISGYTNVGKPVVKLSYKRRNYTFNIPLYGEQSAINFLTAAAIAFKIGLSNEEIRKRLRKIQAVDKRLKVQEMKNFILIDDTYNANPDSMKKSLRLLTQIKKYDNRIAILGDMFELGKKSRVLHEKLVEMIIEYEIDSVYTIGKMMKHLHSRLKSKINTSIHFKERETLKNYLAKKSFENSIVLVKGSRGMKMEEFIEIIESNNK
jgi:UDP-N-acetylmuramoyl-tripeptide--D-alanyl-D-alanine ligase